VDRKISLVELVRIMEKSNPNTASPGENYSQTTISPRLAYISKRLKTKEKLIAAYAGFDSFAAAVHLELWLKEHWSKNSFDLTVRPGKRTESNYEVKIRRPTQELLDALIQKAKSHVHVTSGTVEPRIAVNA
jgi:hypothetical protein